MTGLKNKMSTKIYIDWEDNDVLWNEEIRDWEDVYYIVYDLGGARDPREWCDHPFDNYENECKVNEIRDQLQRNLDRISEQYKQRLIEVMIQMGPDKFKDKKQFNKKDIKITVDDIQSIAKEVIVKLDEIK
jgi:hypothetical protein